MVALKRAVCVVNSERANLLGGGVLGDGLGALRDGVLGQLTGEEEADSGLDLAAGDGGLLVVVGKAASFGGDALEDIVDEGVHDGHGAAGDSSVGVDLLQHLVDVDAVAFLALSAPLLVAARPGGLGLLRSLLSSGTTTLSFSRHDW